MDDPTSWKERALRLLEEGTLSYAEIGNRVGHHATTVRKLADQHGIKKPPARRGPPPLSERPVISGFHRMVGVKLYAYRGVRGYDYLADHLGVSRDLARAMESGTYDFKLSELQKISEVTGKEFDDLFKPNSTR